MTCSCYQWTVALLMAGWLSGCGSKVFIPRFPEDSAQQAYAQGLLELEANNPRQALLHFKQAKKLDSDYAPAFEGMGLAYLALGQNKSALEYVRRAKAKDPDYPPAWIATGRIYAVAKRFPEAVVELEEALGRDKTGAWRALSYYWLGQIHNQWGKPTEARSYFEQALAIDPLFEEARKEWRSLNAK